MAESNTTYVCLNCDQAANSLYKVTEGKFIKLMNCIKCGNIVDHYVECERSIIITDLIMQESAAFKHVLYNSKDFTCQFYMKLALCIILSEGYIQWLSLEGYPNETRSIKKHEIYFYKMCALAVFEIIIFSSVVILLQYPFNESRSPEKFIKAVILGQSGRLLNIPAIIYKQNSSIIFQTFIHIFVFASSVQSLRAISDKGQLTTAITVAGAFLLNVVFSYLYSYTCYQDILNFLFQYS